MRQHLMTNLLRAFPLALLVCCGGATRESAEATADASGGTSGASGVCVPGTQEACGCAGGVESHQVCKADGRGFAPCVCDILASGGFSGASGTGAAPPDAGSDAASGGGGNIGGACAAAFTQAERLPLDMFIMLDQSGSMAEGTPQKWNAIKSALTRFAQSPESAGFGIGIQYFPLGVAPCAGSGFGCSCLDGLCFRTTGGSCSTSDYSVPDVVIAQIPGVAPLMIDSLDAHSPNGGTPTGPALEGAMIVAIQHAQTTPDRKTIVVLATDGEPNDCGSTVDNVSNIAAVGFADSRIETFVISIGNVTGLNQIAQAGGTEQALIVDTANPEQGFLDAMNAIRSQIVTCGLQIPTPAPGSTLDLNLINVVVSTGGARTELIYAVPGVGACDPTRGGWYYNDPLNPTTIELCPATCTQVQSLNESVSIELGCSTIPIPPNP
jgi:hypothetical protein